LLRLTTALTGGDRGRAEDLVQETLLRSWTHRNNLGLQHRSPRAWLMTIARRLAIDAHRARRARPQETGLNEEVALTGGLGADATIDDAGVRAAIAPLPGPQRQVLAEIYYRDRSVGETARILQIPPGTVRSRIFYGWRALRRTLARDAVAQPPGSPRRCRCRRGAGATPHPPGQEGGRSEMGPRLWTSTLRPWADAQARDLARA
jgi:RNA polymerase sigma-70 factor (ECF subfamily)